MPSKPEIKTYLLILFNFSFRVRAINQFGSSPWSAPSRILKPKSSLPLSPINVKVIKEGMHFIELSWESSKLSFDANKTINNIVSSVEKTTPLYYHLQYRKHITDINTEHATDWINFSEIPAESSHSIPEIQEITTLVDPHSKITQGCFWIQLRIPNEENNQRILSEFASTYISKKIPFDATAKDFKESLQVIRGIGSIRVYRYGPNFDSSTDISSNGAYTWKVEFFSPGYKSPLPLIDMHKHTLDGICASCSSRIQVRRYQMGQPALFKTIMSERIDGLVQNTTYDFRIRGKNEYGQIGAWSNTLSNVSTLVASDHHQSGLNISEYVDTVRNSDYNKMVSGNQYIPGNTNDVDYVDGIGVGGYDNQNGGHGLVVIISQEGDDIVMPTRKSFNFIPGVVEQKFNFLKTRIDAKNRERYILVKLWGAGGGGGNSNDNSGELKCSINNDRGVNICAMGGGGGYIETKIHVIPGETFTIVVGKGGLAAPHGIVASGDKGGFEPFMVNEGGSGGGNTAIYKDTTVIASAGGGGGVR